MRYFRSKKIIVSREKLIIKAARRRRKKLAFIWQVEAKTNLVIPNGVRQDNTISKE